MKTAYLEELYRQPSALRDCISFYRNDEGASLIADAAEMLLNSNKIICTGMGSSLYAPYMLELETHSSVVEVRCADAGELLHFGLDTVGEDTALIAVSQSGESAETKKVAEYFHGKRPLIAIVNDTGSSMAYAADLVLPLCAGEEQSISAKTYANTLAVLLLLSAALRKDKHDTACARLLETADAMDISMADLQRSAADAAAYIKNMPNLHVVARGYDLVTARQFALILKEGAGLFTEALSGGLFRHGPIELAGPSHAAVFIASIGTMPELTTGLAGECAANGSRVLLMCDNQIEKSDAMFSCVLANPHPSHFPLMCAPFIGFFVHELAELRGREAGVFRHASKITDRE